MIPKLHVFIVLAAVSGTSLAQNFEIRPDDINFHRVREGLCTTTSLRIVNTPANPVSRPKIKLADQDVFALEIREKRCPDTINAGATCKIRIRFCPQWLGDYQSTIEIDRTMFVPVRGEGVLSKF